MYKKYCARLFYADFTRTSTTSDNLAHDKFRTRIGKTVRITGKYRLREEGTGSFKAHLGKWINIGIYADSIERLVSTLKGHVVGNERQMTRINLDTIDTENRRDFLADCRTCSFNTVTLADCVNVVGVDRVQVNLVAIVYKPVKVDALSRQ